MFYYIWGVFYRAVMKSESDWPIYTVIYWQILQLLQHEIYEQKEHFWKYEKYNLNIIAVTEPLPFTQQKKKDTQVKISWIYLSQT